MANRLRLWFVGSGFALSFFFALLHVEYFSSSSAYSPSSPILQKPIQSSPSIPRPVTKAGWNQDFPLWSIDYSQPVHITHVFSSYTVPRDSQTFKELMLVQWSWLSAAQFAKQTHGIQVEFIDCTLPGDAGSSPSFATRFNLTWLMTDIRSGKRDEYIPTIGEYYRIAFQNGKGEYVLGTNTDIGVSQDFYVKAYKWASRDYTLPMAQMEAIKSTAKYYSDCFVALVRDSKLPLHQELCVEDAKSMYANLGGYKEVWHLAREEVARYAAKLVLSTTSVQVANSLISAMTTSSSSEETLETLTHYEPQARFQAEIHSLVPADRIRHFAGTITRIDVDDSLLALSSKEEALQQIVAYGKTGDIHPGNDCFLMTRSQIPASLQNFPHPTGLRPFGSWIVLMLLKENLPFRRIDVKPPDLWTFHVGKGLWGGTQDKFRLRVQSNPLFFLFLAGNFNVLSHNVLGNMFANGPLVCTQSMEAWRQKKYCANFPCVGSIRYGCERWMNPFSRDGRLYTKHCHTVFDAHAGRIQEPICAYCNQFLPRTKQFKCLRGKMSFCDHLPSEVCGYLPELTDQPTVASLPPTFFHTPSPTQMWTPPDDTTSSSSPTFRPTKRPTRYPTSFSPSNINDTRSPTPIQTKRPIRPFTRYPSTSAPTAPTILTKRPSRAPTPYPMPSPLPSFQPSLSPSLFAPTEFIGVDEVSDMFESMFGSFDGDTVKPFGMNQQEHIS